MMRKFALPLLAFVAIVGAGTYAFAVSYDIPTRPVSIYGDTSYGALLSFDSFRYSVRKRFEAARVGGASIPLGSSYGGGYGTGSRPVGGGYSGGRDYYGGYNAGGGYYNQNYGQQNYNQNWNQPPPNYGQWNPPPLPQSGPGYNAPMNYNPNPYYGNNGGGYYGGGNVGADYNQNYNQNWNNDTWNQNVINQPYSYNGSFASDSAYAQPYSRSASYSSGANRRMLDCIYYSGFTVWGDLYQTWAKQKSRGNSAGYRYRTFGPAVGLDWTNGPLMIGAAMTYNWGKLHASDVSHDIKLRSWMIDFYAQYNADNWYFNGTLGYAHNRYTSDRRSYGLVATNNTWGRISNHDSFKSNAWNLDFEYGWKLNWKGLQVVPNVGLRYFHDRRGGINEDGWNHEIRASGRNYHVWEMPIGVNVAYEIMSNGMMFIPRGRLAWIPELSRKSGGWSGSMGYMYNEGATKGTTHYSESGSKRNRHGFQLGLGLEARISKSLSAHIDYNLNFRSKAYEHHWNFGAGFTF